MGSAMNTTPVTNATTTSTTVHVAVTNAMRSLNDNSFFVKPLSDFKFIGTYIFAGNWSLSMYL